MHASQEICCEKSEMLSGKKIALAVTGSVAAVESVKIARELIRHGAEVHAYLTSSAQKFVGKDALQFATGNKVICELSGMNEHLEDYDIILVCPATADIISKAACGMADDAVSTLILANLERCVFVPAMNRRMYENPILRENLSKLEKFATIVKPRDEEGEMKVPSREYIAAKVMNFLHDELKNHKVLVIGGAGYEKIDNFRIVSNLASGATAIEIAKYAYFLGAEVKLMMGLGKEPPDFLDVERFGTVEELIENIDSMLSYDVIIVPAALPDFKPSGAAGKISMEDFQNMEWEQAPKFLEKLGHVYDGYLVGFKAEWDVSDEELIQKARERMNTYHLNMVVANDLRDVVENNTRVLIITHNDVSEVKGSKRDVAEHLLRRIADELKGNSIGKRNTVLSN